MNTRETALAKLGVVAIVMGLCAAASGDPIEITYEGNDFPENVGWTRELNGGPPGARSVADGIFTLDTLADGAITDWYEVRRPGEMTLDPGETLILEWRVRIAEARPAGISLESTVGVFLDDRRGVVFDISEARVVGGFDLIQVPIEPGVFHDYRAVASDTETYSLFIDGEHVADGQFFETLTLESVQHFGATIVGDASRAEWDYVHMRIVPEPGTWILLMPGSVVLMRRPTQHRSDGANKGGIRT